MDRAPFQAAQGETDHTEGGYERSHVAANICRGVCGTQSNVRRLPSSRG